MSPQVKPTSRGLVIVTAGVAGSGPVDTRHERATPRAPSEMVASWMPGRRFLGTARSPSSHVGTTREQQTGRDPSAQNVTLLMKGPRGVSLS